MVGDPVTVTAAVTDVTDAAPVLEETPDVAVIVLLQGQEVTVAVTVVVEAPFGDEEGADEVEAVVDTLADEEPVVTGALLDVGADPNPPETIGKAGAGPPTAEQTALPACGLDAMHKAPFGGSSRLSSQLPAPNVVPEQRRMMGPPAQ